MKIKLTGNSGKPHKKNKKTSHIFNEQERDYILNETTAFSLREAYNVLRTNIIFSIPKEGCKVIGVTSGERTEGKSINSTNLAISFAETGSRVLLLDCDFRKPKIGRLLGLRSTPGITNGLVGLQSIDKAIQKTKQENLSALLAGDIPPNPTELLGSVRFGEIIKDLRNHYDYIIIDTPPVNVVADASIISKHLDGFLFIVQQGSSERDSIKDALKQLKFANANILGFLLNNVTQNKRYGNGKRYRKYERYGYEYRAHSSGGKN